MEIGRTLEGASFEDVEDVKDACVTFVLKVSKVSKMLGWFFSSGDWP